MTDELQSHIHALRRVLAAKYPLSQERFSIGAESLRITTAGNVDDLVDRLIAAGPDDPAYRDERLPYWAEVWPSSVALAEHVLASDAVGAQSEVIEIGCGLGLAGLAAMAKGASVLFTDYDRDALAFVELNALVNFGRMPTTALMDWRRPALARTFDVVLAADVAYEKRFFDPLIEMFRALLKPGGRVLVGEPNRPIADGFFKRLRARGWQWAATDAHVTVRGAQRRVRIYEMAGGQA